MSTSNTSIQSTDIDVELSTQELRALTPARRAEARGLMSSATATAPNMEVPATSRRMSTSRLALIAALVIAPIAAFFIARAYQTDAAPGSHPARLARSDLQDPSLMKEWERIPDEQGEPVRFVNPFDATEVFEFPPGTTRAQAREAVAEILKARAMERDPSLAR